MDTSKPFEIRPASEGGFCVLVPFDISNGSRGQVQEPLIAAFSKPVDLLTWLAKEFGITVHAIVGDVHMSVSVPGPIPAAEFEKIGRVVRTQIAEPCEDPDAPIFSYGSDAQTQRLVPRQVAKTHELATPDGPMMPWEGKFFPEAGKGLPCVVRLRNGDMCSIHTGENDGCRWEWDGKRSTDPLDVVGYWLA